MSSVEMPRKYAVLKQFTQDLDRLLAEAETGFDVLKGQANPTQAQILAVYRPIHSLKGICGMVEETKLLVRAFHALEDSLPPLVPVRVVKNREKIASKPDWTAIAQATFSMAHEVEQILIAKLELWKQLGADDNESRGLVIAFTDHGTPVRVWVGITALVGLVDSAEVRASGESYVAVHGTANDAGEVLLVEVSEGVVAVHVDEIASTCTRLEAVQIGAPTAFKDWLSSANKRRKIA
jgi:chemotaxis protein histidine kinase CheA